MGFEYKPAAAPPPTASGNFAKLYEFAGKLMVIRPYDKTLSKFKDDNDRPQEQIRSTVVLIQGGSYTNTKTGDVREWEAGEVFDVFVSQKRVQAQISEPQVESFGDPVLGRLLMEGNSWVLSTPTDADDKLAKKVLKDVELPDKQPSSDKNTEDSADSSVPW